MKERIKLWFEENKERLLLFFGVFLVGILCFEAGLLQGKIGEKTPLVLSVPPLLESAVLPMPDTLGDAAPSPVSVSRVEGVAAFASEKINCAFVGSKNSNKYHLPSCTAAKRIKPENRVCFASKEEAEKRGYVPSCLK